MASLTLHGYFRSSCTNRARIALLYKKIDFEYIPVNLTDDSHLKDEYKKLNPSLQVPTLFLAGNSYPLTQSPAILEYLEEAYPDAPALLPEDPFSRAQVRSLVAIICCDIQPVTNMKVAKKITAMGADYVQWARDFHALGFDAIESLIQDTAGQYCFGDKITLADVCLAPAVWNAERWGLDMSPYPIIQKVYKRAAEHSAFRDGHWKKQVDTPQDLG